LTGGAFKMMSCIRNHSRLVSFILLVVGGALLAVGCAVKWQIFPQILDDQITANLKLEDGTEGYTNFLTPPVPIYMDFHFFNVENAEGIKKGDKPKLKEIGPYVYKEIREKRNVTNVSEDLIYYNEYRAYVYDQEATDKKQCKNKEGQSCSAQDTVSILNPVLALLNYGLSALPANLPPLYKGFLKSIVDPWVANLDKTDDLIFTKPVNDILYAGAKTTVLDRIMDFVKDTDSGSGLISYLSIACAIPGLDINKKLPFTLCKDGKVVPEINPDFLIKEIDQQFPQVAGGTFGIFKGRNDTVANSFYSIDSGASNIGNYLSIKEYNGETSLPKKWWAEVGTTPSQTKEGVTGVCHKIKGTDGTMFAPGVQKDNDLWIFVNDLCRSIWLSYTEETEVEGIATYRYRAEYKVFNMSNADNFCYCPKFLDCVKENNADDSYDNTKCKEIGCLDGLIDVSECLGGAPITMCSPHFYNADPILPAAFDGIKANPDLHDTILDVEPITGVAMNAGKKIQINFPLKKNNDLDMFKHLKQNFFAWPVFWANENAKIDKTNADKFKSEVQTPMSVVNGVSIGLGIVLGGILVVIALLILFFVKPRT